MQINIGIIRRCEQSFLRERLSTCQLKPVDSVVLTALDRHGQCNQDTLCSIVNIDKGRMARVMERLEGRSLIRRLINPDNKREKLIEMTEQGKQMLESSIPFPKNGTTAASTVSRNKRKTSTRAIWKESREMPLQERRI